MEKRIHERVEDYAYDEIKKGEEKFYLDTSIWLDFYEKRGKNGEKALKLIEKLVKENKIILYSNLIIKELKNLGYFDSEINDIFKLVKSSKLKMIHVDIEQIKEMRKILLQRDIPKKDILHAILARDNEAILITRNWHFQRLRDIVIAKLPEDFI